MLQSNSHTMNAATLNSKFGIDNTIGFEQYQHTTIAKLSSPHASAKVSLYGAHVLSFIPNNQKEVLFVSDDAVYKNGKAIRGGIPICWPWFNAHPVDASLPSHGFARISNWEVTQSSCLNDEVSLELTLSSNSDTMQLWPYHFKATLLVTLGKTLEVSLTSHNLDTKPFDISAALHTYFNIADINTVKLEGLDATRYHDDVLNTQDVQADKLLSFGQRTDRRYLSKSKTTIHDVDRYIKVGKTGSGVTVVWNPGEELAMQMPDLLGGYKSMLCVEAANSLDDTITVQPGTQHTLSTTIVC